MSIKSLKSGRAYRKATHFFKSQCKGDKGCCMYCKPQTIKKWKERVGNVAWTCQQENFKVNFKNIIKPTALFYSISEKQTIWYFKIWRVSITNKIILWPIDAFGVSDEGLEGRSINIGNLALRNGVTSIGARRCSFYKNLAVPFK